MARMSRYLVLAVLLAMIGVAAAWMAFEMQWASKSIGLVAAGIAIVVSKVLLGGNEGASGDDV